MLDTSSWELYCSPRLHFTPPPYWQCTQGWRGKWDVQYVHSLTRSEDHAHMLVGMEFENRCPAVIPLPMDDFSALVEATLGEQLTPDPVSDARQVVVDARTSRIAF